MFDIDYIIVSDPEKNCA